MVMLLVSRMDYHILLRYSKYAYPVAVVLGIAVLFFGKEVNGQKRWFALGPLSFQPAEFAKIVYFVWLLWLNGCIICLNLLELVMDGVLPFLFSCLLFQQI